MQLWPPSRKAAATDPQLGAMPIYGSNLPFRGAAGRSGIGVKASPA